MNENLREPEIFIIEGSSGSRRDKTVTEMAKRGYSVLRGMPSRYSWVNETMEPRAQQVFGCLSLDVEQLLELPSAKGKDLMERADEACEIQLAKAKRLRGEGRDVILDCSRIRLASICFVVATVALEKREDAKLALWSIDTARQIISKIKIEDIGGIVVMDKPLPQYLDFREDLSMLEICEPGSIDRTVRELKIRNRELSIKRINATSKKIDQVGNLVENFMRDPKLYLPFDQKVGQLV